MHSTLLVIKTDIYWFYKYFRMLEDVPWVGTTADCWTGHHSSYLGVTVHWLDPETRERKQAVLACRRLKGSHTFDVLAHAISEIHSKFQLQDKVRRTTTDNGSNFVKAFVHFAQMPMSCQRLSLAILTCWRMILLSLWSWCGILTQLTCSQK